MRPFQPERRIDARRNQSNVHCTRGAPPAVTVHAAVARATPRASGSSISTRVRSPAPLNARRVSRSLPASAR